MAFNKTSQTSVGAFSELFQYTYADVIIKLLDSVDDVEKWIDSINQEDWNGGDSMYQLYKTSEGSGSRFVSGGPGAAAPVLPAYNPPSYSESMVRLYPHMDIVEITGPKLMRAHDKPGMYRQIMDELVSDVKNSHKNRVGPKYWGGTHGAALPGAAGFANSGVIGVIPAGSGNFTDSTGATPNIPSRQRETDTTLTNTKAYMATYAGCRYLRPGMQVQIGTPVQLQGNTGTSGIIQTVNQAAQTFTLDVALGNNAAQMFIVEGDANGNEWGNSITGLADAIEDIGTYHGIDRATAAPWQSFIVRNGNTLRDFNHWRITSLLMRMADLGPKDVDEMDPVIFSHNSLLQVYLQEIDPVYMQTDLKALKGHKTIAYQYGARQIPWETARSAPLNSYTIMDRSAMKRVKLGDYGWDTSTGAIFKQIPGTFAFQAYAYNEFELVCENPRCQGREEDIRVPTGLIST
tara:strand:+ start:3319 stop:4701 length:1383 start_codon:yes stop_codon:yes gene_type:complete